MSCSDHGRHFHGDGRLCADLPAGCWVCCQLTPRAFKISIRLTPGAVSAGLDKHHKIMAN